MRFFLRTETRSVFWPAGDSTDCLVGELEPRGPLRSYVERIRVGLDAFPEPVSEQVLPDGGVHLLFNLGSHPTVLAMGATSAPTTVHLDGELEQIGVQLRPGGVSQLLGVPASELNGHVLSLEDLWGRRAMHVLEELAELPHAARAAAVQRVLLDRLRASDPADRRATECVRRMVAAHGNVRIRDLAEAVGVGERRLEQIFHRDVGLSPKTLCRIIRFRSTVDFVHTHPKRSWSEIAQVCGYYDQAHLVNELRAIAGITPGTLAEFGFFQYALGESA